MGVIFLISVCHYIEIRDLYQHMALRREAVCAGEMMMVMWCRPAVKTHGTVVSIVSETLISFIQLFRFSRPSVKTVE